MLATFVFHNQRGGQEEGLDTEALKRSPCWLTASAFKCTCLLVTSLQQKRSDPVFLQQINVIKGIFNGIFTTAQPDFLPMPPKS